MHTQEQLQEMHSEHAEWQNKIRFYRSEISRLNRQLDEVVLSKPPQELMATIEHFQNQFTVQSEVLDIMRHDFKQHENDIEAGQSNSLKPDVQLDDNHQTHVERLDQFEKIFREIREEFSSFLQREFAKQF